jgi:hypothetical protein
MKYPEGLDIAIKDNRVVVTIKGGKFAVKAIEGKGGADKYGWTPD